MLLQEVVFCATTSPSPAAGSGTVTVHDFKTGAALVTFKQNNAAVHCTAYLPSNGSRGGFFVAAQPDKPIINIYNFQKVIEWIYSIGPDSKIATRIKLASRWLSLKRLLQLLLIPEEITAQEVLLRVEFICGRQIETLFSNTHR
jgi:hypothetical protein